jgi:hypothetical protein
MADFPDAFDYTNSHVNTVVLPDWLFRVSLIIGCGLVQKKYKITTIIADLLKKVKRD